MMLGLSRVAMAGGGGWTNPYQTADNALAVCMDVEWGVEDGVWTDIVNGYTATIPSAMVLSDKHLEIRSATGLQISNYEPPAAAWSVEYVFSPYDTDTVRECLFEGCTENEGFRYRKNNVVANFWNRGYMTSSFWTVVAGAKVSLASTITFDGRYHSSDYVNGELANTGSGWEIPSAKSQNGFQIGRTRTSNYTTYQDVYSIRVYNRVLTAAEVLAHATTDNDRFNLT